MARIRSVKPEYWDDDAIGALSRTARLLFIATWTFADDEGLVRWSPAYLKASAFMYDDDLTTAEMQKWMSELEGNDFVFPYSAGRARQRIGFIVNFRKHQRIDKPQPGKLPPPPWSDPAVVLMYARRDDYSCHLCGEPVNQSLAAPPADSYNPDTHDQTGRNPSPDHLVPRSKGGSDYPTNIKTAHVSCNKGRGARPVEEAQVRPHSRKIPGKLLESVAEDSRLIGRDGMGVEGKRGVARG